MKKVLSLAGLAKGKAPFCFQVYDYEETG